MPSTYTLNNGIELIGTGEQSGTWGDTTNTNFELIDTALDGQVTVTLASAGTSGSPNNLPVSDGATSDGRNRLIIFNDGGDLGATAYVQLTPNDAEKIIYVRNDLSGSRSIILFQGTYNASNDYEVPAGTTAVIYFDGAGSGAVAANVFNNAYFDSLRLGAVSVTEILDEDDMASDSETALATQQSIKAYVDTQVGANNELSEVLVNGNTSGGTNIQMSTTDELQFRDTAIKINSSTDGKMDIDADLEVEIVAPTVDIDASTAMTIDTASLEITGAVDMNTSLNVDGDITGDGLTIAGNVSVDGGTIKLDGNLPGGTDNVALGDTAGDALTTGGINNTAVGSAALSAATTQDANTAVGYNALNLAESSNNTAVGSGSGALLTTGPSNTAVGQDALNEAVSAGYNTAVGAGAGDVLGDEVVATALVSGVNYTIQSLGTTDFTLVGAGSNTVGTSFTATGAGTGTGTASANANYNTLLGHQSGNLIVGGSKNTVLGRFSGNQGGLDIRNSDNNIVLSDGDGNPRLSIDSSGDMNVNGTVTSDGLTVDGDATFGDNNKAIFGAGSDLQIYHDGTNSYIDDAGTGTMRLRGFNQVRITDLSDNIAAIFKGDAEQTLYHNNSAKLATTSTGVDVTGTVTADGLTVDGATDGTAVALLRADNTGVTKKNTLRFEDTDTTTQNDQQLGRIEFYSNDTDHTGVDAVIEAVSATTGLKELRFLTSDTANTPLSRLAINKGGDISFYDSAGSSQSLFWDASAESLGIGTTSPSSALEIAHEGTYGLTISSTGNTAGMRIIGDSDDSGSGIQEWEINVISGPLTFSDNTAAVERMRIDSSGNLLVSKTSSATGTVGVELRENGKIAGTMDGGNHTLNRLSSNGDILRFQKNTTTVGSVSVTGTSTAYNTSSDYRLKEDVQPMVGASERLLALKPVNFAWKADGSRVDGFLAHEAQAVVPEAVTGEKDAVDEDGNPDYQAIDQSKLVPLLTAALQEALNKIDDLEARVAALEAK